MGIRLGVNGTEKGNQWQESGMQEPLEYAQVHRVSWWDVIQLKHIPTESATNFYGTSSFLR